MADPAPNTGEPAGTSPPSGGQNTPPPQTFSAEYVRELRHENAGYRLRATEAEKKAAEAAESAKKAAEEAEGRAKKAEEAAQARIIRAEMKAHAIKAGIVDLDGLALADLSQVKINEQGEVTGADEAIAALKKAKPYLFTTTTGSGGRAGSGQPPAKGDDKQKRATDMTPEEYRAFKASKGIR